MTSDTGRDGAASGAASGALRGEGTAGPAHRSVGRVAARSGADDPAAVDGIVARDVTVTYRNGHTALRHASFALPRGTITALVGVNGAGKSTLFKAIMGFVPAGAGSISLLGRPVQQALRENLIAYVPQAEEVDWSFPVLVEDVVMMGRYGHMNILRRPRPADRAAVDAALARVGMTDYRHRQIGELSGGQKKRVFLARALAQDGQVILLDEPFTGVDVVTEDQIISLLRDLRAEGRVMLVSTHNLGSVPAFCDRVVMVKGTVLAAGPTATTFTHDNLEAAFGGTLRRVTLDGTDLHHDAEDARRLTILTDDERPFVHYGHPAGAGADAGTVAGKGNHTGADDGDTGARADAIARAGTSTKTDAGARATANAGAGAVVQAGRHAGTGMDAGAGARVRIGTDIGGRAEAGGHPGTGTDAGAGMDTDALARSDADAARDVGAGTDTGTGANVGTGANTRAGDNAGGYLPPRGSAVAPTAGPDRLPPNPQGPRT